MSGGALATAAPISMQSNLCLEFLHTEKEKKKDIVKVLVESTMAMKRLGKIEERGGKKGSTMPRVKVIELFFFFFLRASKSSMFDLTFPVACRRSFENRRRWRQTSGRKAGFLFFFI